MKMVFISLELNLQRLKTCDICFSLLSARMQAYVTGNLFVLHCCRIGGMLLPPTVKCRTSTSKPH